MTPTERRLGLGLAMSLLDTCGPHGCAYREAVADLRRVLKEYAAKAAKRRPAKARATKRNGRGRP